MNRVQNNYAEIARERSRIASEHGEHGALTEIVRTVLVLAGIWLAWIMVDGIFTAITEMVK